MNNYDNGAHFDAKKKALVFAMSVINKKADGEKVKKYINLVVAFYKNEMNKS